MKDRPETLDPYALYVIVEKGQLKVVHVFGKQSTSLTVGEGLNRDEWHSVLVRIDVHQSKLIARVDDKQEETTLEVLKTINNYGVSEELASVVLIGGRIHNFEHDFRSLVLHNSCLITFCNRFEFRGTIAWGEIHHRVVRRLHQRHGFEFRKVGERPSPN